MFKKKLKANLLLVFSWLIIITFLRWEWHLNFFWFWTGSLIGIFLINLDHFIYLFFTNPHELTSQRIQRLWEQKRFKELIILASETTEERTRLAFHNAFFQIILFILCFFVLTSTNSLFGIGLVMGMALHLLKDEFYDWLFNKEERLNRWLFWPLKMEVSLQNQRIFLIGMLLFFIILNFFLI